MNVSCGICGEPITGPFLYHGKGNQVFCQACLKAKDPKRQGELARLAGVQLHRNEPAPERAWTPDDDFDEVLSYMLMSERERTVVERFFAEHPGPGMLAWLTRMANIPDELLLGKHRDADTTVVDAAMGRIQAHCADNGWGPFERKAFYAELIEARRRDAEECVARRLNGSRRSA